MSETANSLPEGWLTVQIGSICDLINGDRGKNYPGRSIRVQAGIPFINAGAIGDGTISRPDLGYISNDTFDLLRSGKVALGDVVYCIRGSLGKVAINSSFERAAIASSLILIRPRAGIQSRYILYFLMSPFGKRQIQRFDNGTAQPNLSGADLARFDIPLVGPETQDRIIAKIEELFSELDKGVESLTIAQRQLNAYRQSLLKYAFEGKLTADWRIGREQNDVKWPIQPLGRIAAVSGGLTKNPSRNSHALKMKYLRVANVHADRLELDEISEIGVTPEEYRNLALQEGDLLIVEGNGSVEQIGRVAIWGGQLNEVGHQNHLIRVRFSAGACPRFFLLFLMSPLGRELIVRQASSTSGLHTLSISKVSGLFVPVPSLPEQLKVLNAVAAPLLEIGRLSEEIEAALARSNALRQSILYQAFSGRLVSQGTQEELASALIERIRSDCAMNSTKTKKRRQRTKGEAV